jgi:hypothetical protein
MSRVFVLTTFLLLACLRDEFVDATGVGGVDDEDEDDVLFARDLPDENTEIRLRGYHTTITDRLLPSC